MTTHVHTLTFQGISARLVDVQVQIASGLPTFTLVGLPDKAVAESRERVRAALSAIGLGLPPKRITVNLAPADLPKEGSHFDLPIALGLLAAMRVLPEQSLREYLVFGELALDGGVASVMGALPAAMTAARAELGLICPEACGPEAAWSGLGEKKKDRLLAPASLINIVNHFKGLETLTPPVPREAQTAPPSGPDLASVKGQENAKRALEIAAAGGHNMLMSGPPGAGKSMLAACLPGLLPPLSPREALDVSMIASLGGELVNGELARHRPYRAPHHSASMAAMVGGGTRARPGEAALAHLGVLFLDELPEFPRVVLEALRQPIESGRSVIARAQKHITYPSRFQLVAAMNPCRCGYAGDPARSCGRVPRCVRDYQARLSGPLLDRIDICVEVNEVAAATLASPPPAEASAVVAARIAEARDVQRARYQTEKANGVEHAPPPLNAYADDGLLESAILLAPEEAKFLQDAATKYRLSARGYARILRVARTIADLAGEEKLRHEHLAEALEARLLHPASAGN